MICPSCKTDNDEAADNCFRCGKGGMGMVYRAFDREFEEDVAIKVLRADLSGSSDSAKRFRSEAHRDRSRRRTSCGSSMES